MEDAVRIVTKFVGECDQVPLHSAIGYVTPKNMLEGRQEQILDERDAKIEAARTRRVEARSKSCQGKATTEQKHITELIYNMSIQSEDRALLGSNPSAESISNGSEAGVVGLLTTPACLICI